MKLNPLLVSHLGLSDTPFLELGNAAITLYEWLLRIHRSFLDQKNDNTVSLKQTLKRGENLLLIQKLLVVFSFFFTSISGLYSEAS